MIASLSNPQPKVHSMAFQAAFQNQTIGNATPSWVLENHVRHLNAQKAHQRFLRTDIPISLLGTAGVYGWFIHNDRLQRATHLFQRFTQSRLALIDTTSYLLKNANNAAQGRYLLTKASMGDVGLLNLGAQLAESPQKLTAVIQRVLLENPQSYHAQKLLSNLSQYKTQYSKIISDPHTLKSLMVPKITSVLKLSPYQAKHLAQSNPQALIKTLFKQVYGSRLSNSKDFFTRVFSELARANVIRARLAAFGAFVLLFGTFITRMEIGMNTALNPQEAY